jgi:hypothetical protein
MLLPHVGLPPPPQICPATEQVPHCTSLPQPSATGPQL